MYTLVITGTGSAEGLNEPFTETFSESEFVGDLEWQALLKSKDTVASADGESLTWEWDKTVTKQPSIPVTLPLIGKITARPTITAAASLKIVLSKAA